MKTWHVLALGLLLGNATLAVGSPDDPLAPVAFFVGEFTGAGKHPYGAYDETQVGAYGLAKSVIEIRTKSTMQGRTVHEDLRVISWDAKSKALRMRQWAKGVLRVYTGAVDAQGVVTFEETAHEGETDERWRYTFTKKAKSGFTYAVHVDAGKGWKPFVSGDVGVELKHPGKGGGLGLRQYDATIEGMAAQVHHPDGAGPYPAIVFSPGGDAASAQGYRPYGRWFATWGYITVIVAFNDRSAAKRAGKFGTVMDWLTTEAAREGSPLKGLVDLKRLAVAGHSRGGNAALRSARTDQRVRACLALAPSGPGEAVEGKATSPACLIIGDQDQFLAAATAAYKQAPGERFLLVVKGMTHMLGPREATLLLVERSTAFLNYALKGDGRYREPLMAGRAGLTVKRSAP